jgi:prepilin-type N-terminal cleavage/methylation domain-containing protein
MPRWMRESAAGFSLVEMLVAMAAGLVVTAGAVVLFRQGVDVAYMVTQRAEMQQNARVAINMIARDLSTAATGMPPGGIQLPSGTGHVPSKFACDQSGCYVTSNTYGATLLYAITPGWILGPTINGTTTDVVVIVYRDSTFNVGNTNLLYVSPNGDQIRFAPATSPAIDNPATGITIGDVLAVCTAGCAAGVVTGLPDSSGNVPLGNGDPLSFNQPLAAYGNIKSLQNPLGSGNYPNPLAYRILIVTYYLDPGTSTTASRLMRQVNAQRPVPVAENIENLQFSYDIFNDVTGVETSNLRNAGGTPNQIRKVNISVGARAPLQRLVGKGLDRVTLATSISPRNVSFSDRYK